MVYIIFILGLVFPLMAFSAAQINEVAWMGTVVEGVDPGQWWRYEWIELRNPDTVPVNLSGWVFEVWGEELEYQSQLSGSIPPEGYYLIASSDRIPGYDLNYANLGGKLRNGGSLLRLKDALGNTVEELDARGGWPAGDNEGKLAMARGEDGSWGTSYDVGGTPGAENKVLESVLQETKKRPESASLDFSSFSLALPLALASAFGVLALRRRFALEV
ncbi:MAG: lamin tail domain-containing protein [bacterium]|nr:lamin tail domain-containing protein [bacterium]